MTLRIRLVAAVCAVSLALPATAIAGLADSPWPMLSGDARHTSQSVYRGCQSRSLKWSRAVSEHEGSSPAIGEDGTVYVGSDNGRLYAVRPDGSVKWSYLTGDAVYSTPAIDSTGTIYVGSSDGQLYAINPDGTKQWSYQTGGTLNPSVAIDSTGTIYAANGDGRLFAFNPDGTVAWSFRRGEDTDYFFASPAIGPDGTVYVAYVDSGIVYAVNPDGTQKWFYDTGNFVQSSPAVGGDGTVYVASWDQNLHAINPNGTNKWTFDVGDTTDSSPAIGSDGVIYVGSHNSMLYAVNPDGTLKWSYGTDDIVNRAPAIGSDGVVYACSADCSLYAIKPDGTLKWSHETDGPLDCTPAVASDGTIYVNGCGYLYAFATPLVRASIAATVVNAGQGAWLSISVKTGCGAPDDPPDAGAPLRIECKIRGTSTWSTVGTTTANALGQAVYLVRPNAHAYYRAVRVGDATHVENASNPDLLYVRYRPTLYMTPARTRVRRYVRWYGTVHPTKSSRLRRVYLQIYWGRRWISLFSTRVSSTGTYRASISAMQRGTYRFRVYMPASTRCLAGYSRARRITWY